MRRTRLGSALATLGLVLLAGLLPACSRGSEASLPEPLPGFCEAAQRYDRRLELGASISEQITILEKLERNAPKDVAADASFFLDTMREGEDASERRRKQLEDDPGFQRAVENVQRRAINGCGFFESEPGDGS